MKAIEYRVYKDVIEKIIKKEFKPGVHTVRWFANKFDISINSSYNVFNNMVSKSILIPSRGNGYEVNNDWLDFIFAINEKKDKHVNKYFNLRNVDGVWHISKETWIGNEIISKTESKIIIDDALQLSDFDNGINYLLYAYTDLWDTYKEVSFSSDHEWGNVIIEKSETYSFDKELIESSITIFRADRYKRKFKKIW